MNATRCCKDRSRDYAVHRHVELSSKQDRHRRSDCRTFGGKRGNGHSFPAQQMRDTMSGNIGAMEGRAGISTKHFAGAVLRELLRPSVDADRMHAHSTVDDKPAMRRDVALMRDRRLIRELLIVQKGVQQSCFTILATEDCSNGRDALSDIQRSCSRFVQPSG